LWLTERNFWYNFNVVTDDCTAKRQPILVNDVATAVLNALKLEKTAGKIYDIGIFIKPSL
jgi:NADH dehydrogenase (ubiquinone) 1 alpha subcomplex subunit 9